MNTCKISEREARDVAQLLSYAAERQDIPPQCSALMRRGASLLIQLSAFCTMLAFVNNKNTGRGQKDE